MKKQIYVIAYDVVDDRKRNRVAKALERLGQRVNLSVFECALTPRGFSGLRKKIAGLIDKRTDTVIYYPLCLDCRAGAVSDGVPVYRLDDRIVWSA